MHDNDKIRDRKRQDAITRLVGALRRYDLPSDTLALLEGLLLTNRNDRQYEGAIRELFDGVLKYDRAPDEKTYRLLGELREQLGMEPDAPRKVRVPFYRRTAFRVAAVVIPLMLVVGGTFFFKDRAKDTTRRIPVAYATVSAVAGSPNEIVLPDSSAVRLRGNSTLCYAENFAENRSVILTGEAFFSVTKDERHPFTVEGGPMKVTVRGTEFNVRAYENDIENEVVLSSGSVSVTVEDQTIVLEPMQRLRVDKTDHSLFVEEINESELLRIRGLVLDFNGTPLRQAFLMLGDYYGMRVEITGNADLSDEVVMTFDENTTLEDALYFLQLVLPKFNYTIEGDTITISSK